LTDSILEKLNDKQIEAVKIVDGPVLVISGPGSGKTRCLTHRIAHLISAGVRPQNILAVTFTNKATEEMRNRVSHLLNFQFPISPGLASAWPRAGNFQFFPLITFHSICARILRNEIGRLGYSRSFNIFDDDDQLSLTKKIMAELEIDTQRFNPRGVMNKISSLKTELKFPENYDGEDFYSRMVAKIYKNYQSQLQKMNVLDFDDLIVLTVKIFKNYPEVLDRYQEMWRYILVDEYQDTSYDQYVLINLLGQKYRNLFCIGDDAQSIYQFRRADIRNILNFERDYPEAKIIMLEQNYRSTKNILNAAQEIISNNKSQIPKSLWTDNNSGHKITVKESINERMEAQFIVEEVEDLAAQGYKLRDFAVLYRTHAQSRAIEEAFVAKGFPYQIIGGIKFYQRKEIKDILAYLKFINNPNDIASFERIYNIPPRGLGKGVFEKISRQDEPNLIKAVAALSKEPAPPRQSKAIAQFLNLLNDLSELKTTKKLTDIIKAVVKKTGYENYLINLSLSKSDDHETNDERIENLKELLTVTKKYDSLEMGEGVEKFLEEIALLQDTDKLKDGEIDQNKQGKITLMTAHASKGLEFPVVFLAGMEEGLFPHSRTLINPVELEEERRLCYVAVTRAKERLIITTAKYRNIFGSTQVNLLSRFVNEIPTKLVDYQQMSWSDDETIYY